MTISKTNIIILFIVLSINTLVNIKHTMDIKLLQQKIIYQDEINNGILEILKDHKTIYNYLLNSLKNVSYRLGDIELPKEAGNER